jgi:hypothetical protein
MRLAVGMLMSLGAFSMAWADDPPPSQPVASPTDQQAAAATAQGKPAPADTPAAVATSNAAATAAAPPTKSESAPAATPASTTAQTSKNQDLTDDEKKLLSRGYKLETRGGQKFFCHSETLVGSRFPTKTCRTAEQMAAIRQNSKDYLNDVQRSSGNPPSK